MRPFIDFMSYEPDKKKDGYYLPHFILGIGIIIVCKIFNQI
jgi:hypothetical protein